LPGPLAWDFAALNNSGRVVATIYGPDSEHVGVIWDRGSGAARQVTAIPGSLGEQLADVNEAGDVVGSSAWPHTVHPALCRNGVMEPLPELTKTAGQAFRISDSGMAAGYTNLPLPQGIVPAVWDTNDPQGIRILPTLSNYGGTANDINNSGTVVGRVNPTHDLLRSCMWNGGQPILLPDLGGRWGEAVRVNDSGQVLCMATDSLGTMRSYLWSRGTVTLIGAGLPGAIASYDMNDAGACVGTLGLHAFLFQDGVTHYLDELLENPAYAPLNGATAINDLGQILAIREVSGGPDELVLLTPVPAPGGFIVLVIAAAAFRRRR
jgi:uncharacterized membrane protein